MGDSATDSEPPSGAALAVALGRGNEAGLLAAYEAYGPDLFGYAECLLAGHPDADRPDQAAGAVLDALLVATGAVGDLTDPDRMLAWLLALTRNESLRRGAGAAAEAEAAELGRRGLGRFEIAALLGFAPAALPRRVPPEHNPPDWLRTELLAAAGPEAVALRAELTRRARPFEPDGFPIPVDRRRLSGKVLAWSAAAVVVVAVGLLVALPTKGNAGSSAVPPAALAEATTPTATAAPADDPVPHARPSPVRLGRGRLGLGPLGTVDGGGGRDGRRRALAGTVGVLDRRRSAGADGCDRRPVPDLRLDRGELLACGRVLRRHLVRAPARDHGRRRGVPGDGSGPDRRDGRAAPRRRRLVR